VLLCGALIIVSLSAPAARAGDRAELERVALAHYDAAFLARGRAYHVPRYVAYFVQTAVMLAAAWALAAGPLGRWSASSMAVSRGNPWLARLLLVSLLYGGFTLLALPFTIWRYLHARAYGLRHDAWGSFLADWAKGVGIGWILVAVVGLLVLACVAAWPRWGWAVAASSVTALSLAYAAAAPLVIDPLFNKITPLADHALEQRLLDIARAGGVPAKEVLVSDGSRRSRAVNAYFTGLGKTQRIVVYDTLLEKFPPEEVGLVVAHEAGHWKHHHVTVGLALGLAAAALGLFLGQMALSRWVASGRQGLSSLGDPALAIPAYALYLTLSVVAVVPSNWISRRMETQADRASIALTGDPETFIRTEERLGRENLSDVLPPAWIETVLFSHPANTRRILFAERSR
jgi:STE24 endopeptidase